MDSGRRIDVNLPPAENSTEENSGIDAGLLSWVTSSREMERIDVHTASAVTLPQEMGGIDVDPAAAVNPPEEVGGIDINLFPNMNFFDGNPLPVMNFSEMGGFDDYLPRTVNSPQESSSPASSFPFLLLPLFLLLLPSSFSSPVSSLFSSISLCPVPSIPQDRRSLASNLSSPSFPASFPPLLLPHLLSSFLLPLLLFLLPLLSVSPEPASVSLGPHFTLPFPPCLSFSFLLLPYSGTVDQMGLIGLLVWAQ